MTSSEISQLTSDDVLAACRANAAEIGATLGRTLDVEISVTVGDVSNFRPQLPPSDLLCGGVAVVIEAGGVGAALALPDSTGLVPAWCTDPDPTGVSRLATLAQELSLLVVPDTVMAEQYKAVRVRHLAGAISRGGVGDNGQQVRLELSASDGRTGVAILIWPLSRPTAVLEAPARAKPKIAPPPRSKRSAAAPPPPPRRSITAADLPLYSKSLLKIELPVVVTLARKRQPLGRIVELGPGSIIQFDKSCEEMLELEVGGRRLASGEAVKVGDKFGLRITSMILPDERFKGLRSKASK